MPFRGRIFFSEFDSSRYYVAHCQICGAMLFHTFGGFLMLLLSKVVAVILFPFISGSVLESQPASLGRVCGKDGVDFVGIFGGVSYGLCEVMGEGNVIAALELRSLSSERGVVLENRADGTPGSLPFLYSNDAISSVFWITRGSRTIAFLTCINPRLCDGGDVHGLVFDGVRVLSVSKCDAGVSGSTHPNGAAIDACAWDLSFLVDESEMSSLDEQLVRAVADLPAFITAAIERLP